MIEYHIPFRCEVVTPKGVAFAGELASAILPATDGLMGVLHSRASLLALLGSGAATFREPGGVTTQFYISGGFVRFQDNVLTLLPGEFLRFDEIDPEVAWQAIEKAQAMPRGAPEEAQEREEAIRAARSRFNIAQKHRKEAGEV